MTSLQQFIVLIILLCTLCACSFAQQQDVEKEWWEKGCLKTGICARRVGIHGVPEGLAKQLAGIRPSAQFEIDGSKQPSIISFDAIYGGYYEQRQQLVVKEKETNDKGLHVVTVDEENEQADVFETTATTTRQDNDALLQLSRGMFWHGQKFERLNEFRVYLSYNDDDERVMTIECVDCQDSIKLSGVAGSFWAAWSPYVVGAEPPDGDLGSAMEFALDRTRVCTETYSVLDDNGEELNGRGCAMFALHAMGFTRSLVLAGHSRAAYAVLRSLRSLHWSVEQRGFAPTDAIGESDSSVLPPHAIDINAASLAPSWSPDVSLGYSWSIDGVRADVFDFYRPRTVDQRLWGALRSSQKQLLISCAVDPERHSWLGKHRYPRCLDDYRKGFEHASEAVRDRVALVIHSLQLEVPMLSAILSGLGTPGMSWRAWVRCEGEHFCVAPVDRDVVPHACPALDDGVNVRAADVLPMHLAPHPMSSRPYRLESDRSLRSLAEVRAHFLCLPHLLGEFPANVRLMTSFAPPSDARLAQALYATVTTANDLAVLSAHVAPAEYYSPQLVASTPSRAQVNAVLESLADGHMSLSDVESPPQPRGIFSLGHNATMLHLVMQSGFDAAEAHFHYLRGPDAPELADLAARFNESSSVDAALLRYADSVELVLQRFATLRDIVVQPNLSLRTGVRLNPQRDNTAGAEYSLGMALYNVRRYRAIHDCVTPQRCMSALASLSALPDEPIEFGEHGMSAQWRQARVVECTRRMIMQTMLDMNDGHGFGGIADLAFAPPSVMLRTVSLLLNDWSAYRIGIDWSHPNVSRAAIAINSRHIGQFLRAAYEGDTLSFDERRRLSDIGAAEADVARSLGPLIAAHNATTRQQADELAARLIDAIHPNQGIDIAAHNSQQRQASNNVGISCPASLWRFIGGAFQSLRSHQDTHTFLSLF